jgi:hypothetical protein
MVLKAVTNILGEIITFVFHLEDEGNKLLSETTERSFKIHRVIRHKTKILTFIKLMSC